MKVSKYLRASFPRCDISMLFKFGELPGGLVTFQTFLRAVLMEALLRDTYNTSRAPCILLNLPLRLAAVGCTVQ